MTKQHGLIFDVDGVIADTERINAEASIQVFAKLFGIHDIVRADFEAGLGRGAAEYIRSAARVHGLDLSDAQVEAAAKARQTAFLDILRETPLPAFPGVVELIDATLARADFCVGIATSSTREKSEAVLRSARIPYARMAYITGSDVKNRKPDPELFLKAAAMLDLDPERCVVIEDAPDGVAAAKAAGCRCVAVTNSTAREKLSEADVVVESLNDVDVLFVAGLIDEIGEVE
jgi:HAD superfamily hydrolase (TIGR01509 family)